MQTKDKTFENLGQTQVENKIFENLPWE